MQKPNDESSGGALYIMPDQLRRRLAQRFGLSSQLSSFLALLITSECATNEAVGKALGEVEARALAFRLRKRLREKGEAIEICSHRSVGYWLSDETRRTLAKAFGVELGISHEGLRCRPNAGHPSL